MNVELEAVGGEKVHRLSKADYGADAKDEMTGEKS